MRTRTWAKMGPAFAAIVCTHLCGQVRRSPIHLAPRQRGEGGAQRVSVGRVRGARSLGAERLVKMAAVSLRGGAKKEVIGTPLTLPLLRNGSLPLPASRASGVWAVLGRDMAGQDVNPIVADREGRGAGPCGSADVPHRGSSVSPIRNSSMA